LTVPLPALSGIGTSPAVDVLHLRARLAERCGGDMDCRALLEQRPTLFAPAEISLSAAADAQMRATIAAVEQLVALPAWREAALARAPEIAQLAPRARGVFFGYDFHLGEGVPQLIEINTNAGGGLLNAALADARHSGEVHAQEHAIAAMFREEWRLERGEQPLRSVAIVDDDPAGQYLYPEFLLFCSLMARHGLDARVADAAALTWRDGALWHGDTAIDLVYNRVTDFMLEQPAHAALRAAWANGAVVLTPHPLAYALYADKRNLALLSDAPALRRMGAAPEIIETLARSVPRTLAVTAQNAETLWQERRKLFFKPMSGFGGRGAYRGEKLTRRVWQEILDSQYVAQTFVPPSTHVVGDAAMSALLKVDIRCYVYAGAARLIAARLYQGQTTNFRTPHGGFAAVVTN
jgi:hypothetical protein